MQRIAKADQAFLYVPQNVVASGVFSLSADAAIAEGESISEDHVRKAFALLQQRHVRTRAWVSTAPTPAFMHETEAPPPPQRIECLRAASREDAERLALEVEVRFVQHVFVTDVRETLLLFGVICCEAEPREFRIVACASHLLVDVQGIIQILKEMVFLLGNVTVKPGVSLPSLDEAVPLLPPSGEAANLPAFAPQFTDHIPSERKGLWNFLSKGGFRAAKSVNGMGKWNDPLQWALVPEDDQNRPKVVRRTLSADTVDRLLRNAKAHNTTLHGGITLAIMQAYLWHLTQSDGGQQRISRIGEVAGRSLHGKVVFPVSTTVETRRRVEPVVHPAVVTNMSLSVMTGHCMECPQVGAPMPLKDALWDAARVQVQDVYAAIDKKEYAFFIWLAGLIPASTVRKMMRSLATKPFNPITLSNLGKIEDIPSPLATLHSVSNLVGNPVRAMYTAISTFKGVMSITGCASKLNEEDMAHTLTLFVEILERMAAD